MPVRLKKESYQTMLACGTPDTVDRYRQAKQAAARDGPGGKNSGLGGVRAGGELLTSTGDIVGRWKKYFEDLLNPTDLPSNEEAEAGDSEVDSSITQAEVTEVVHLPGKVYARVLERRIRPIVDPRIQEEQCGFRPSRGTLDQLYTLHRVLEGLWEFAQPVHMCFVDLEKAFDHVPRGILWGVLRLNDVVLMASSSQDLQRVLERFAAECEAAGMRISTSKSEAMVLDRKRVVCPLQGWVERSCLKWRSSSISGSCSRVRERSEREIDRRIGAASAVMRSVYRTVVVKKELSRKAKALDLPVNLRSHPHLWS
ncbi:hypothetical protein L3Q82_000364 [Scortum barcoo]|uniref:Uncharacterized protein n=1 Tax=Scortum barcoo TaxID=214431 RepID=A0ACB8X8X4_9TELE|nr:hypothetical protein L3Q82_000364 [Scortum barcoo]